MFVKSDRVAVKDDKGNTVWVRSRLDFGCRAQIQGAMPKDRILLLFQLCILAWAGPDFVDERGKAIPCTAETIATLDDDDPLIEAVGEKINELHTPKVDDAPLDATTAGGPSLPADNRKPVESTTST